MTSPNSTSPTFLDYLEAFNRKERFFLVAFATGSGDPTKAAFRLSPDFRTKLGEAVQQKIPEDALAFMDYHIDWIHAAARLTADKAGWPIPGRRVAQPFDPEGRRIEPSWARVSTGNQEDIDLVVAYEEQGTVKLILLEAKAETGWTNGQITSKLARLSAVFGELGNGVDGITPVFCLTSKTRPRDLRWKCWPTWARGSAGPLWMELEMRGPRASVHGSDSGTERTKRREFWYVARDGERHPIGVV